NRGLGAVFTAALKKYLPFYKCAVTENPPAWHCVALAGNAAGPALTASGLVAALPPATTCMTLPGGWLCQLSHERFLACVDDSAHALLQPALAALPPAGPQASQLAEMLSGHFPFTPADVE